MSLTFQELLAQAKNHVHEVSVEEVREALGSREVTLVDVREADEYAAGCLPGAILVPRSHLEMGIEDKTDREQRIILYCAGGIRSVFAAQVLQTMGYSDVASMAGGFNRWTDAGFPVERPQTLTSSQRERYRRHLAIPEVGSDGQRALLGKKVLLLGAGGLGSPAALYLAAAGVGTLGIVDSDVVETNNLQRQVIHRADHAGMLKTESARLAILALNPSVHVAAFPERLGAKNVEQILGGFDVIVDGGDNFPTRYLLNDACLKLGRPLVHGSVYRFEGQVTTFVPGRGPCYRCLYPKPPPAELAPSCAEAGVLGVLPGVVGLLQATEALKLCLGTGEPLIGRLLVFDALGTRFRELRFGVDPGCPACRDPARIQYTADTPGCRAG